MRCSTYIVIVAVLLSPTRALAVVTSDLPGSHVVPAGESVFGVEPDGVVIVGGLRSETEAARVCSGALISDRHVLTAAHCFDTDGNGQVDPLLSVFPHEIVFDLPEGLTAIEYELESITWPSDWELSRGDIAIVELVEDAPPGIPRYPLYAGNQEVGQPFVLIAYGIAGFGPTGEDPSFDDQPTQRAGRNRVEDIRSDEGTDFLAYDFDSGNEADNILAHLGFESDLGFGDDEVFLAIGDSGSPSFLNGAIAGVSAYAEDFTGGASNSDWGEAGFNTRVSAFRAFLEDATDGAALFVTDGDYDKNGSVDGRDFLIWQREYGQTGFQSSDGNGDGVVNAADFTVWRDNFGTWTSVMVTATVPEPSAAAQFGIVLLTGFTAGRWIRPRFGCGLARG